MKDKLYRSSVCIKNLYNKVLYLFVVFLIFYLPAHSQSAGTLIFGDTNYALSHYTRVVKLSNGNLIATFIKTNSGGMFGFPICKSTDGGKSWSFITIFKPSDYGLNNGGSTCPTLYILPQQLGNYPAGTLLISFTYVSGGNTVRIFRSNDEGSSWIAHGSLAGSANHHVTWEPEFAVSSSGSLVCYYSDERLPGYSQCLVHEISTDGGANWSG